MKNYINSALLKKNMEMKDSLKKLTKSSEFLKWNKKNRESKLAYAFRMDENSEWQFGYYNLKTDKMSTFSVDGRISLKDEQDVFKKPGDKVNCINLDDVKISLKDALEKADKAKKKHYPNENVSKSIAILQNIKQGQLWNITFVTNSFKTINIKIDAFNGRVIRHDVVSLFGFRPGAN